MATFYRREWHECRGDEHDDWGEFTWYFEVGDDGYPVRQVELYANGQVLRYGFAVIEDEFGWLSDQPIDRADFAPFEVTRDVFEEAWARPTKAPSADEGERPWSTTTPRSWWSRLRRHLGSRF